MAILFRIEFWCIGWQVLYMNIGMLLQKRFHEVGSMGTRSIPDQDERSLDMAHQMFQSFQQFFGLDRTIKMPFVNPARDRHTHHRRSFPAIPADEIGRT